MKAGDIDIQLYGVGIVTKYLKLAVTNPGNIILNIFIYISIPDIVQ